MMATSFSFIILLTYIGLKLILAGGTCINLLVSIITLLYAAVMVFFLSGNVVAGQLVKNMVRSELNLFWFKSTIYLEFFHFQERKTSGLVLKMLNYADDDAITQKLMILSTQLQCRLPNFNCGFFSFDLKLAFSVRSARSAKSKNFFSIKFNSQMISTATVYLIILIQFEASMKMDVSRAINTTSSPEN